MMAVHDDCHRPTRRDADGNLDVSDVLPDEEKALEQGVDMCEWIADTTCDDISVLQIELTHLRRHLSFTG